MAGIAAVVIACGGGVRRAGEPEPVVLKIGTFLNKARLGALSALLSTDPLVAAGWDGHPVFRIAESATLSADGLVHTLKLRRDVRFHTGEMVTAPVVREILIKKLEGERKRDAELTGIQEITASGNDTLVIRVSKEATFELADLNIYTVSDDARPLVRTGPFMVANESGTALDRFEHYYQGRPSPSRIEITLFTNQRAAWTAMMRGEVNFLHEVNRDAIDFIEAGGNIKAHRLLRPYYIPLVFNLAHPVLKQREVRVALNQAVDRQEIVDNGMRGLGRAAQGPFWPHHWAYSEGNLPSPYSPEAAMLRLDAAGLPVRRGERGALPSRFAFTCLMIANDPRFERIALVLQRQLFSIGVDMQVIPVSPAEFGTRLRSGDFDTYLYEMTSGRTLSWVYRFWHSPVPGSSMPMRNGYTAADAPLERMRTARHEEDVRNAVADVAQAMRDDPPALFLVWPYEARAVEKSISVPYEQDRDIFGTFWQARRTSDSDEGGQ